MATRREHYVEAENLLRKSKEAFSDGNAPVEQALALAAQAQVHATLATVEVSLSVRDA